MRFLCFNESTSTEIIISRYTNRTNVKLSGNMSTTPVRKLPKCMGGGNRALFSFNVCTLHLVLK